MGCRTATALQQSRDTLVIYNQTIDTLKSQLSVTDENVSQTSAQAEDKLKHLETEIRKLWDNVWRKASRRLDEHEAQLTSLKNQQGGFVTTLNDQTAALQLLDGKFNDLQQAVTAVAKQAILAPQNEADVAAARQSISSLISRLEALGGDLKKLRTEQRSLAAQSAET